MTVSAPAVIGPGSTTIDGDPAVARAAAARLRHLVVALDDVEAGLGADAADPDGWSGGAALVYTTRRRRLQEHLAALSSTAYSGTRVIERFADELAAAQALQRKAAQAGTAELGAGLAASERALRDLDQAAHLASRRLNALADGVPGRSLEFGDHVQAAALRFWQDAIVGTWEGIWSLVGDYFTDRNAWYQNLLAGTGALVHAVRHPVRTLEHLVDADAWRSGRWGEGVGAVAALVGGPGKGVGRGLRKGRVPLTAAEKERWAAHMADPGAPMPRRQTVAELFAGVVLARHEHALLGHSLRRHVNVDDAYLRDRLTYGTILDDGTRAHGPPAASRFTDLATAESSITEALRANRATVEAFLQGKGRGNLTVRWQAPHPVGQVMTRAGPDFPIQPGRVVEVTLGRENGLPCIRTAFVDVGPLS